MVCTLYMKVTQHVCTIIVMYTYRKQITIVLALMHQVHSRPKHGNTLNCQLYRNSLHVIYEGNATRVYHHCYVHISKTKLS